MKGMTAERKCRSSIHEVVRAIAKLDGDKLIIAECLGSNLRQTFRGVGKR